MSALRIDRFPFLNSPRAALRSSVSSQEKSTHSGMDAFSELLDKATQSSVTDSGGDTYHLAPLSKTEIISLVDNVRMSMNKQLLQALAPDAGAEIDIPGRNHMGRFILPGVPSSNNDHLKQNNDVSATRVNDRSESGVRVDDKGESASHVDDKNKSVSNLNNKYEGIISDAARTHGVDAALVRSVIKVESDFNSNSTSPKGAMGLMQLMPGTARDLGVQNAYDPVENIGAGTRYLKTLLNRYDGNIQLALAAYNWGMGNLEKRPGQMPAETRQYIDRVTGHYEKMKA